MQPAANYLYRVELYDFHGNKVEITVPIEFARQEAKIEKTYQNSIFYQSKKTNLF